MAYSTSNPPYLISKGIGNGGNLWRYDSTDAIADVDAAGYFSNAGLLGMKSGDAVLVWDSTNSLLTIGKVVVSSGAGTLTALTAVP